MTDETMPNWVLIEAAKRCGRGGTDIKYVRANYAKVRGSFRALCDMILKHEQPPVDRKVLCAREAMARRCIEASSADEYKRGNMDGYAAVQDCVRAIELYEEGFGK